MGRNLVSIAIAPATALLDRLHLGRKLVVIALVLIAPALFATRQFRSQQDTQIAFSAKERVGVRELVPAGRLLADLARARGLALRAAGGDREAADALPAANATVARSVAAFDATDRELRAQLGTGAMWARLSSSIKATLGARPSDARAALGAYDRLTEATLKLIVQAGNVQPHPRPGPRLLLRDGRVRQQLPRRGRHCRARRQSRGRHRRRR